MTSRTLDQRAGAAIYLKCENYQRVGAFKFRGAYNAMAQLSEEDAGRGVITHSSGNHAQAIALVGRLLGIRTTIVMPDDAPATKRAATEAYGAAIVEYDPADTSREKISQDLARQHGYKLIPPYDHIDIVAGQGTAALELLEEISPIDMLLVPCGGGGLLSGSAIAAKNPTAKPPITVKGQIYLSSNLSSTRASLLKPGICSPDDIICFAWLEASMPDVWTQNHEKITAPTIMNSM